MILNKWVLFFLNLFAACLGAAAAENWQSVVNVQEAAIIIASINSLKAILAAFMPPNSQQTIVSTGNSFFTHT